MAITSNDYIIAVKEKYELEKNGIYGGFLIEPTSALLRDLCLLVFDKGLKKKDEEVFANFFKPKEEKGLRKAIENVDVEKLRTVCNFLKGVSKKTNLPVLNLIAVIVDYEMRPFSKFITLENKDAAITDKTNSTKNEVDLDVENKNKQPKKIENTTNHPIRNIGIGIIGLLSFLTIGYSVKDVLLPKKQCMQWTKDHYEKVSCDSKIITLATLNTIKAIDSSELNLKKITVCDTTIFFEYDKPIVWYHKFNNEIECFNADGKHPVTGRDLKPITPYMVKTHFKK